MAAPLRLGRLLSYHRALMGLGNQDAGIFARPSWIRRARRHSFSSCPSPPSWISEKCRIVLIELPCVTGIVYFIGSESFMRPSRWLFHFGFGRRGSVLFFAAIFKAFYRPVFPPDYPSAVNGPVHKDFAPSPDGVFGLSAPHDCGRPISASISLAAISMTCLISGPCATTNALNAG